MVLPCALAQKCAFQYWPLNSVVVYTVSCGLYISPNTSIGTSHLHIGKTDDNKQIAMNYTNKAIFLLNFTINIRLQPKPGSQEMHDNTITC